AGRAEVLSLVPDYGASSLAVDDLVDGLVRRVRQAQPEGPYAIAGFSFGGVLAYELAGRLGADGDRVTWLGILDAPTPRVGQLSSRLVARVARLLDNEPPGRRAVLS